MKQRQWLINLRGDKTQQEVANKSNISQNHYSWIENGERNPSIETAKAIAKVLSFEWIKFFNDKEETPQDSEAI
ncbi:helix-turn-helix domain-containing protein [Dehalobacterium formicoaceticum]|uniref:helix-turn-helix domain-containing protein n=1 Tax=Dehalobacterium formicoaceticum TaxID=51515 RepID=UPI0018E01AED|nr:helix-turn-helix transcriptional regulator [Dehalobacterium formicoaceticum]